MSNCNLSTLDAALQLAKCGCFLVPIKHGAKGPTLRDWPNLATTDEQTLRSWFSGDVQNIGLTTGSKSGVFALDVDKKSGGLITLQNLLEEHGSLPITPAQRTGGGGNHFLFKYPEGVQIKNAVSIAPGLDIRGERGVIVVSPSTHENGRMYEWLAGQAPWQIEVAVAPDWLLKLMKADRTLPTHAKAIPTSEKIIVDPDRETVFKPKPAEAQTVVDGCRAIQSVYRRPKEVLEWIWKMALSVIARTEDGRRLAHKLSALDPDRYSELDTDRAVDRMLEMTGPFRCNEFAEHSPDCARCPFRYSISTPLQLGRENRQVVQLQAQFVYASDEDVYYDVNRRVFKKSKDFSATFAHKLPGSAHIAFIKSSTAPKVDTLLYLPGELSTVVKRSHGLLVGNTYLNDGIPSHSGDCQIWIDHFEYLIPNDEGERDHLLDLIAHTLQQPQHKIRHAVLIKGRQRTGKSTVSWAWQRMLGNSNVVRVSNTELGSSFQGGLHNKQLAVFEELFLQGRDRYNDLKELISENEVRTQKKGIDFYEARTPFAILALSNNDLPIMIPEADDRRWFVVESLAQPRDKTYYERLYRDEAALSALKAYLLSRPIGHFDCNSPPPMTAAKQMMIEDSQSPVHRRVRELLVIRNSPIVVPEWMADETVTSRGAASATQVRDALKGAGASPLRQIRINGENRVSPWVWQDHEKWKEASADEVRAVLMSKFPGRFANGRYSSK